MATEREALRALVENLSDAEVRELLGMLRQRSVRRTSRRPAWVGALHEGPHFAKNAKETIRAELSGEQ